MSYTLKRKVRCGKRHLEWDAGKKVFHLTTKKRKHNRLLKRQITKSFVNAKTVKDENYFQRDFEWQVKR